MRVNHKEFVTMPAIAEVVDLYDAGLLVEQAQPTEHSPTCPTQQLTLTTLSAFLEEDECTCPPETLYAIGSHGEEAAGILPYSVTPSFRSVAELEAFCKLNLDEFRRCAETDEEPNLITPK